MKPKRKGRHFTYIVECGDGTYYTGYTPDLKKRLLLHNKGKGAKYTRDRRPVKLVWCREYKYFKPAFLEEKRIKKLKRPQKEILVRGKTSKCLDACSRTFGCHAEFRRGKYRVVFNAKFSRRFEFGVGLLV